MLTARNQARRAAAIFFCSALYSSPVVAQDMCRDILQAALFNQTLKQSNSDQKQAAHDFACASSSDTASSTWGANTGFNWGLIGGKGDFNHNSYEEWKTQNCHNYDQSLAKSSFDFYARKSVDPKVADNWLECMKQKVSGLSCFFTEASPNLFILSVTWKNELDNQTPIVYNSSLSSGVVENASGLAPHALLPKNKPLLRGTTEIPIKRTDNHSALLAVINAIFHNASNQSCKAYVAAMPPAPPGHKLYSSPRDIGLPVDPCAQIGPTILNNRCDDVGHQLVANHICQNNPDTQYRGGATGWQLKGSPGGEQVAHWEADQDQGPEGEKNGKWVQRVGYAVFESVYCSLN